MTNYPTKEKVKSYIETLTIICDDLSEVNRQRTNTLSSFEKQLLLDSVKRHLEHVMMTLMIYQVI